MYNVTANRYLLSYIEGSQQLTVGDSNQTGSTILAGVNISTVAPTYIGDASNTASLNLTAPSAGGAQFNITRSGNNTIRMGHQISTSNTFDIYDITNSKAIITYGTSTQNLTISNGPTGSTIINGPGGLNLVFPASPSLSGGANTLDDYEEGTFTPTLTATTSGSITTGASSTGSYVKVGKAVFYRVYVVVTAISSPVGLVRFNLPFLAESTTNILYSACFGTFGGFNTNNVFYSGYFGNGDQTCYLMKMSAASTAASSLIGSDLTASTNFVASGFYYTAS
jgi:hypothetical protein